MEDISIMNITENLIEMVLPETIRALEDFERDRNKYPLFELTRNDDGSFSEMIFNDGIMAFFGLILQCRNHRNGLIEQTIHTEFDSKTEYEFVTELEYNKFLHYFLSDIKMSMLKDALINLVDYFESNESEKEHSEIRNELFYDFNSFAEQIKKFVSLTGLADPDAVIGALTEHEEIIHLKVPKLCFPWFAYALCHTYKYFPKPENRKKLYIVNGKHLSLNWTRSDYSDGVVERDTIEKAQKNFRAFIKSLEGNNDTYNRSLNMYLFNETTNLYDIFNLVNLFPESPYMKYQNLRMENGIKTTENANKYERYLWKWRIFEGVSHIAAINTLGVKTILIDDYFSEELFTDLRVWDVFNKIFSYTKSCLLDVFRENQLSEYKRIVDDIRLDYAVFRELHKEEPFEDFLADAYEGGLPIYIPSENEAETHLYDAYYYAYKNFYLSRFKRRKESKQSEKY